MDITTLLSELVIIANSLEKRGMQDVSADLDAALFIISQETALPRNKSLASVVKEHKLSIEGKNDEEIEKMAVEAAEDVNVLFNLILEKDKVSIAAILKSLAQSMQSILDPNSSLSVKTVEASAEFLAEAERKLFLNDECHGAGYQVEMLRRKIENG